MKKLLKRTLSKVRRKIFSITIEVDMKHPMVQFYSTLDWNHLIELAKNARESNGKQNRGPIPHYRELIGAIIVRAVKSCSLRDAMDFIQYHGPSRLLCELADSDWTPDFRTISDFEITIGDNGLNAINEYFLDIARSLGFLDIKGLCGDTTAQEASIPYPTELGLCHQFISSVETAVKAFNGKLGESKKYFAKKAKAATIILKKSRFFAKTKEEKSKLLSEIHRCAKLVNKKIKLVLKTVSTRSINSLKGNQKRALSNINSLVPVFKKLSPQISHFEKTGQVIKNKIISLYQEELRAIPRGKDGKKTEFGLKWLIGQVRGGYIFGRSVEGNLYEGDCAVEILNDHKKIFGDVPKDFGYDRGGWSDRHLKKIEKIGVENIGVAPKGKASWLVTKSKQKEIFSERAQVEGKIGTLKMYGFNNPRSKTTKGMKRIGQMNIIRFNLGKLAKDMSKYSKISVGF